MKVSTEIDKHSSATLGSFFSEHFPEIKITDPRTNPVNVHKFIDNLRLNVLLNMEIYSNFSTESVRLEIYCYSCNVLSINSLVLWAFLAKDVLGGCPLQRFFFGIHLHVLLILINTLKKFNSFIPDF